MEVTVLQPGDVVNFQNRSSIEFLTWDLEQMSQRSTSIT
jgi:hypothetical protein